MNILVVGNGGREHALCYAINKSPQKKKLYCAPGNGGISKIAECVAIDPLNFVEIKNFCIREKVDLVIVGPEAPLVNGIVDYLDGIGIKTFGPSLQASKLEGSKSFMKSICRKYNIPTAGYKEFDNYEDSLNFIKNNKMPLVIKVDGLAAGKGVTIALDQKTAIDAIENIFIKKNFGDGAKIIIEDFLDGEEASFFIACDGKDFLCLPTAQDHKRVGEGETGPNTGGMGAYSPAPIITNDLSKKIIDTIIKPTLNGLLNEGIKYKGILYAGLMIVQNKPLLLEYNVRFGDPECQPILYRLKTDIIDLFNACVNEKINKINLEWDQRLSLTVVLASNGYPGKYTSGSEIKNLEMLDSNQNIEVFHSGTKIKDGKTYAVGGRVLGITTIDDDIYLARKNVYGAINIIDWPEGFFRKDIGWRIMNK